MEVQREHTNLHRGSSGILPVVMLGGTIMTHECLRLDYCLKESLASLLGCCDEIVVVDAESKDGTLEYLWQEARKDNRIQIEQAEWKPTQTGGLWLSELANIARSKLHSPYHLMLQADEVLHEDHYPIIRGASQTMRPYQCRRHNFWKDAQHIAPHGTVCGHLVTRMAPSNVTAVGDAENLGTTGTIETLEIGIFHYGFLRHAQKQIEKGISMESDFWGRYNPIYDQMAQEGSRRAFDESHGDRLMPCNKKHPAIMRQWLKERGYG